MDLLLSMGGVLGFIDWSRSGCSAIDFFFFWDLVFLDWMLSMMSRVLDVGKGNGSSGSGMDYIGYPSPCR